jgi:hypothetical protein
MVILKMVVLVKVLLLLVVNNKRNNMYLKQLLEDKTVKAVHNTNAPKGVHMVIERNKDGKAISTTTIFPNSPVKHKAILDMKHPLDANTSDKWEKYEIVAERSVKENVEAAVKFITTWLTQGKDMKEKESKAEVFAKFVTAEGGHELPTNKVFEALTAATEAQEALLVKFITTTIQIPK